MFVFGVLIVFIFRARNDLERQVGCCKDGGLRPSCTRTATIASSLPDNARLAQSPSAPSGLGTRDMTGWDDPVVIATIVSAAVGGTSGGIVSALYDIRKNRLH